MTTKIKKKWSEYLIQKDLNNLLNLYNDKMIFKGTYMHEATKDNKILKKYFKGFSPIVKDVVFLKNNTILRNNDTIIEIGNYNFKTEKGLVKARYNFVFAKIEGSLKIISHFSEPI